MRGCVDGPERPRVVADLGHVGDQDGVLGRARGPEALEDRRLRLLVSAACDRLAQGPRARPSATAAADLGPRRRSSIASSVALASPTRPKVFLWLRPISSGSTSIWTTSWPGLEAGDGQPACRPPARRRRRRGGCGAGCAGQSAAPSDRSLVVVSAPLPSAVWTTPAWRCSATAASASWAPDEMDAAARVDGRALGAAAGARRRGPRPRVGGRAPAARAGSSSSTSPSSSIVSGGMSMATGRGRPVRSWAHRGADGGGNVGDLQDAPAPLGDRGDGVELVVHLVQEPDVLADARLAGSGRRSSAPATTRSRRWRGPRRR